MMIMMLLIIMKISCTQPILDYVFLEHIDSPWRS